MNVIVFNWYDRWTKVSFEGLFILTIANIQQICVILRCMAKILEINTVADSTNAVGRLMMATADYLRGLGHQCVVAAGRGDFSRVDFKIGTRAQVYRHYFGSRMCDSEGHHSSKATRALIDYMQQMRPDVVHLHNLHGHYLNVSMLMGYLAHSEAKIVLTLHDLWWITGHCTHFSHNGCAPWFDDCRNCPWHRREYPRSFIDRAARNLQEKRRLLSAIKGLTVVVPSEWMRQQVSQSILADRRCVVIPNGVLAHTFHLPPKGVNREGILCVAARWSRSKGLDDIIDLASQIDMPITVVGDMMGRRIDKSHINHIPQATPAQLASLYQSCAMLVNPSQVESYGMVTAEALSCGAPVIVNAGCAASVELLSQGGGVAVTPDCIAEAVSRILKGDYPPITVMPPAIQSMTRAYASLLTN